MKTQQLLTRSFWLFLALVTFSNCTNAQTNKEVAELKAELAKIEAAQKFVQENLETFDDMDFNVFTNQEWERLHESHTEDVIVHWPDGHFTEGIERHIKDLDAMFVYAPDTRIQEHPIKIGSGNITAVMGVMEGSFTEPMPIGQGKFIQPNGNKFKVSMVTIGLWNEDGIMYEEYLFWDNQTYMKQLGLVQ